MRKISGVLLALAASLALGATTVAAKDYGGGGGGGGGGEKMQNDGKGGEAKRCKTRARGAEAVKKCVVTKSTATWSTIIAGDTGAAAFGFTMTDMVAAVAIARVMHAPIAGAGAVRVSVAASGTTAAKKSAVSQTFNGGSSKGGRRLCERMKPLARRDAGRCLASLSSSEHLRGVRISVVSRTSPSAPGSPHARPWS